MSQPTAIAAEAEVAATLDGTPKTASEAPAAAAPEPIRASPEQLAALLKTHNITDEEYAKILAALGRMPSLTELGIYSVMWSEHCSYKSSRVHLKRLPTRGTRLTGPGSVMQGPGENAGIIDVGDGWACAFKIESHNHPSYIEPYQGAATGVGGILRDIFTMGARPMAVMDSLRFGPLAPPSAPRNQGAPSFAALSQRVGSEAPESSLERPHPSADEAGERMGHPVSVASNAIDYAKNRSVMEGVVHGVAGYGNCFGVPNLGGETRFEPCYSGNPLLNAFALGLVRHDEIFYAKATGIGNPVIYVGAKTGRDGIHGATMASEEFKEGSEQKRPNVQMGDPFLEKLLLEACLEAMKTGAVAGIQDMGAAGLTCSICEMGARGEVGLDVELNLVPQRDSGMTSYEIMLSESQERMLLVAHAGREHEVLDVFAKWGLDAAVVGTVIPENRMRIRHNGELVADLSNTSLTDDAPLYHRPVGEWVPKINGEPVPLDPPAWVLEELKKPRDYTADLKKLLASPNICSKRHIYEQYDSMVQTNTVFGPGQAEAGVIRIKGTGEKTEGRKWKVESEVMDGGTPSTSNFKLSTEWGAPGSPQANLGSDSPRKPERGLAMALAGNGRWTFLDPKLGAMHAVAEAARKVACTGATPVAATNCLNFGNPMKPEIMAQLSQAIDGISEACTALGTPITGGNVSLYNETRGEGIYPTPVLGVVGILEDVTKAVPSGFQREGEAVLLLHWEEGAHAETDRMKSKRLGPSEFARKVLKTLWGVPPAIDLKEEAALHQCLQAIAQTKLVTSISDISDGGIAVALARSVCAKNIGCTVSLSDTDFVFAEDASVAIVTCIPEHVAVLSRLVSKQETAMILEQIGNTTASQFVLSMVSGILRKTSREIIHVDIGELQAVSQRALQQELEVDAVLA